MTNAELLQTIRSEIERRIEISKEQGYTYAQAQLQRVLAFLDTLQVDEPKTREAEVILRKIKELCIYYDRGFCRKGLPGTQCNVVGCVAYKEY